MGGRLAVATGLLSGIVVGGALLGGIFVFAPGPVAPTASPPPVATSPAPTAGAPSAAAPSTPSGSPPSPSTPPSAPPSTSPSTPPSGGPSPASSGTAGGTGFGVGEAAPSLAVEQLGGGRIDLANLRGQPVWVNFMATWCPPCRDELPLMAGFAARYADSGLVVLVIDVKEDETAVDAFMKGLGLTLPVGLDAAGEAQQAWGAYALPVHFWVDKDGVVRDGALGGIGPDVMAAGLKAILPGVNVTP